MKYTNENAANEALAANQEKILNEYPSVHRLSVVKDEETEGFYIEVGLDEAEVIESLYSQPMPFPTELSITTTHNLGENVEEEQHTVSIVVVNESAPKSLDSDLDKVNSMDKQKHRPVMGGDSISMNRENSAGTLGVAITYNGKQGYFLTNYHVLSGPIGEAIVQPGRYDGGSIRDRIGTVEYYTLTDQLDLAVGKIDNHHLLSNQIRHIGVIRGVETNVRVGMSVKKSGRTTNLTHGKIVSVNTTVRVAGRSYPGGSKVFHNQIMTTKMLEAGDSGSALVTKANKIAGGSFAGSQQYSYHNHIKYIKSASENGDMSEISLDSAEAS